MSRNLITNTQQLNDISKLVDLLGTAVYRDAKRAAGLNWDTPFCRLYQLEAETVIGIMKEKLIAPITNERG